MRKLLILILITVAVLENLSKAEEHTCLTVCADTHLNGPEKVTDDELCSEVQNYLKCVKESCEHTLYEGTFKSFEDMKDEVNEDNFRCTLEF